MFRTLFVLFLFTNLNCDYFVESERTAKNDDVFVPTQTTPANFKEDSKVTVEDSIILLTEDATTIETFNRLGNNRMDAIDASTNGDQLKGTYQDLKNNINNRNDKISVANNLGRIIEKEDDTINKNLYKKSDNEGETLFESYVSSDTNNLDKIPTATINPIFYKNMKKTNGSQNKSRKDATGSYDYDVTESTLAENIFESRNEDVKTATIQEHITNSASNTIVELESTTIDYRNIMLSSVGTTTEAQPITASFEEEDFSNLQLTSVRTSISAESTATVVTNCDRKDVSVLVSSNDVWTHWSNCNENYDINVTEVISTGKEMPHFRRVESKSNATIGLLEPCTEYNVLIKLDSGEPYEKKIRTRPGEIEDFKVTLRANNTLNAEWTPSNNKHCMKYNVTIDNNETYQTESTGLQISQYSTARCTSIAVMLVDDDNHAGEVTTRLVPGEVQDLQATVTTNRIYINWTEPEDTACVAYYNIQLNNETIDTTKETTYTIYDLEYCTSYIVGVAAESDKDAGEYSVITAEIETTTAITVVQNFATEVLDEEKIIRATWDPPSLQGACITAYEIIVWDDQDDLNADTYTTTDFFIDIPQVPCKQNSIMIKAKIGVGEGPTDTIKEILPAIVANAPTTYSVEADKRSIEFQLTLQTYATNKCAVSSVTVMCTAEDNENYPWIVDYGNVELSYTDSTSRPRATLTMENLSEFTNYTCYGYVLNTAGTSGASDPISVQTQPEVPSAPQNLQITEDADGILISWDEPYKIPGIQGDYRVQVFGEESLHHIPEGCDVTVSNITYDTEELRYMFTGALANYVYSVTVTASTSVGFGEGVTGRIITNSGVSEPPRTVQHKFEDNSIDEYNVSLTVNWLVPCNTNGKLLYFNWNLKGESYEDGSVSDNRSENVNPNDNENDETYQLNVTLQVLYNYSMTIVAYVTGGIRGEDAVFYFDSPEALSSPPLNLRVEDITNTTGTIIWDEPANKNGILEGYEVVMSSNGPQHYIPADCITEPGDTNISVDALTLTSTFTEGLPYFNYTVTVNAVNGAGTGRQSSFEFSTLQSASQAPRDLAYSIDKTNLVDETYNISIDVNWLLPCNTNSDLNFFSWILEAEPLDSDGASNSGTGTLAPNADISDINYDLIIRNVKARYNYTFTLMAISGNDIQGEATSVFFLPPDGYPSAPRNLRVEDITSYTSNVSWIEPENRNGLILAYRLIMTNEPLATRPQNCTFDEYGNSTATIPSSTFNYLAETQPYVEYTIVLRAGTNYGYGSSNSYKFISLPDAPEPVTDINIRIDDTENEIYEAHALIFYTRPCIFNGIFDYFSINIVGQREGFPNLKHAINFTDYDDNEATIKLDAEYIYNGNISVHTSTHRTTEVIPSFTAPAGVPLINSVAGLDVSGSSTVTLAFSDTLFDDTHGELVYYAVIISVGSTTTGGGYNLWDSSTWPTVGYWANLSMAGENFEYQATPAFWNPFTNQRRVNFTYVVGEEDCVASQLVVCNGPLLAETEFGIRIRAFTKRAYRDGDVINFTTLPKRPLWIIILGIILGVLALCLLGYFILILWRKRKRDQIESKNNNDVQSDLPPPIPKNKFIEHCELFDDDRSRFKSEYSHLESVSALEKPSSDVAMDDSNRKKNRYINIMAYDNTRVKLATDDNDNYKDYINASYIKGYSGRAEYIATQGPMESTCEDFWRMILQEDVGVIVMVAQFVEQSKQKCYKYLPLKEETMLVGKDINVKCISEVDFKEYITRTLLVEKDGKTMAINHLQYMLWPDFGCPNSTISMLEFREIMRKEMENTKSKAVVHCSAGVGRTGTLIAIDILLQKIDNTNEAINVFGTVSELRKQRTHMVQTEKQYEYIHKCIKDYLILPKIIGNGLDNSIYENLNSPIYENVSTINGNVSIKNGDSHISTENLIRLREL